MTTQEFINAHRDEDTATLALRHRCADGVDLPFALQQIAAWQAARRKIPTWAATEGVVYPAHISMEQCSSEQAARYKRKLVERLLEEAGETSSTATFIDLTGGFGVDFTILAPLFRHATYVERTSELCAIVRHNLPLLGVRNAVCEEDDCARYMERMPPTSVAYIDPARRDCNGKRTYAISDCTPDITTLLPTLTAKVGTLLLKLSPMLDITQAVHDIEANGTARVTEVHVVAVANECKELLLVIRRKGEGDAERPLPTYCTNDGELFTVGDFKKLKSLRSLKSLETLTSLETITKSRYHLYEPNAAIMKVGCFGEITERYGLTQIDDNSHLFVSPDEIGDFPGRRFTIRAVTTMKRDNVKTVLAGLERANVAVRNFPMSADALRKRLRLKDGGDTYIFGTTVQGNHLLLVCDKEVKGSE